MKRRKLMMNLVGKTFGHLTVLAVDHEGVVKNHTRVFWRCQCDCGKITVKRTESLKYGKNPSCGHTRSQHSKRIHQENPQFRQTLKSMRRNGHVIPEIEPAYHPTQSSTLRKNNKSGVVGVTVGTVHGKKRWIAKLYYHGHYVLNKACNTKQAAIDARIAAEQQYLQKTFAYQEKKSEPDPRG